MVLKNIKRSIAWYFLVASPNTPDKDIWSYYELLLVSPVDTDEHLVVIIQVPLVDKSLIMNVYEVYHFPILHPVLKKKRSNIL